MLKVGVVGCGTIGSYLVKEILKRYKAQVQLVGICELEQKKINDLRRSLEKTLSAYPLDKLIKMSDLVIEAADSDVVPEVISHAVALGKDVMAMSVGGLYKYPGLLKKVKNSGIKLYAPSGAVAGLDALKAAKMGMIKKVTLTTKKPVAGLFDAPYIKDKKINLNKIKKEEIIFKGTAEEAVAGFPKNINVAAVLSLAGIGAKKTNVCIIASRLTKRNVHTIEIEADSGKIICCTENVPSELNPKTSKLAMLSALATLDGILHNIRIGT